MAATTATGAVVGKTSKWVDDRFGSSNFVRRSLNKVFPDHWSFMIGEIALYSFVILLITGVYLTFFYEPSTAEVIYQGSYEPLRGTLMSEAMASTVNISFDVKGGLWMRQMHHWSALLFVASIAVHAFRIFFTGAFRKPRETNWVIGVALLVLGIVEGFIGYSLPDDLLSGTGVRIAWSIILAIPVVGTWVAFLLFGGEYPGDLFIERMYAIHILLVPGIILGLITAHMMVLWHQKHTQFRGPGRTETNVVGTRLFPGYAAKAGGFFFMVFAVVALLGGLVQINPIWLYGVYDPSDVTAGSQPDWYMGWLDGAVRIMPNWEFRAFGYTVPLMILIPSVVMPGLVFTAFALYPFIEQWFSKDYEYHNLLDRPRDTPVRTAVGVMAITFYTVLWLLGGNDLFATFFSTSIQAWIWFGRIAVIVLPPLAYVATYRLCLSLQASDAEKAHHGLETGVIKRLPSGEFVEVHTPLPSTGGLVLSQVESDHEHEGTPSLSRGNAGQGELEQEGHDGAPAEHDESGPLAGLGRRVSGFFVKDSSEGGQGRGDAAGASASEKRDDSDRLAGQQ